MDPWHPRGPHRHPDPLSRLSEQTLLVEKLSVQKEQGERACRSDHFLLKRGVMVGVWLHGRVSASIRESVGIIPNTHTHTHSISIT